MIALVAAIVISAPAHAFGDNGLEPKVKKTKMVEGENFAHMAVSSGYNEDIIANGVGPLSATVTNDADNFDYVFISRGFQLDANATPITFGLPENGLISNLTSPHTYQLASYSANNTLRLTTIGSEGTLQFSNAQSLEKLFLLVTSSNGADVTGTVNFSDGTTQAIGTYAVPGWFSASGLPMVATGIGRANIVTSQFDDFGNAPNLFQIEIMISEENQSKMVSGVTITKQNDETVFNLMGATGLLVTEAPENSDFLTIASGFNYDVVANGVGAMSTSTTNDVDNFDYVLISQGLQLTAEDAPITFGLPEDGIISNMAPGPDYQFGAYTANNALRLSTGEAEGTLTFATPKAAEMVYLLVTSSNGANVDITLHFADGTTQDAGDFAVPGWFSNTGLEMVATAIGRGNMVTGQLDNFGNAPNLFQIVVPVAEANQAKQLESVTANMAASESVFNLFAVSAVLTPLATQDFSIANTSVYPNPVSDILTISNAADINNISVYSLSGQLLKEEKSNMSQVSFAGLATGVYFVKLTSATGSQKTMKVIKI
ncbi:T9SS type A sorting domain-containing protein [Flavobacterium sp. RHBU_24]|uniref:T9SS type A sorting domain-containing protein n=1 Tax=Flavobacterium sp. RHBU_24 TaxID=3391185 RepID=UPI0039851383